MTVKSKSVLILSDVPAVNSEIGEHFVQKSFVHTQLGFSTITDKRLPSQAPSCVILILKQYNVDFKGIITRIQKKYGAWKLPVLALVDSTPPFEIECFDSLLLQPCHPEQVVLRAISLIRLSEMEREIGLRLQTLEEDFGLMGVLPEHREQEKLSILFIGKASPEFMVIINALQQNNVQVIAAFTSFTAFDYLYEKTFDAVVMNGLESTEPSFTVAETMRKNAKLYHVPALLLVNGQLFNQHDKAYESGMSDIINAGAPIEEIRTRMIEQANFHRTHDNLKNDFGSLGGETCRDMSTQLYNASFFNAHIKRVTTYFDALGLPTSICLIRVNYNNSNLDPVSLASAYQQVGSMVQNLVRMQDITARLDTNLFAIAFPGQAAEELGAVSKRIASILECAAFTDPISGETLDINLEVKINTLNEQTRKHSAA